MREIKKFPFKSAPTLVKELNIPVSAKTVSQRLIDADLLACGPAKKALIFKRNRTYLLNWPLQPFSQYYDLASHTTHVVCVNFIHECWDLQFKVDSERQIFENLFMPILFTRRVSAR